MTDKNWQRLKNLAIFKVWVTDTAISTPPQIASAISTTVSNEMDVLFTSKTLRIFYSGWRLMFARSQKQFPLPQQMPSVSSKVASGIGGS